MSPTTIVGAYCFCPVYLLVCLSVGLFAPTLTFCHNFCNIEDSNFIFGMHVYLMELHILSGERSRSSFKVKGKNKKPSESGDAPQRFLLSQFCTIYSDKRKRLEGTVVGGTRIFIYKISKGHNSVKNHPTRTR